jgi:trehalose 6-phosphate phosphatase
LQLGIDRSIILIVDSSLPTIMRATHTYNTQFDPANESKDTVSDNSTTKSDGKMSDSILDKTLLDSTKRPNALHSFNSIQAMLKKGKNRLLFFLDYDGTLTPIVKNPSEAIITEEMRSLVDQLSKQHIVSIVTGRAISTIKEFMKLDNLYYAGSHGFDIRKPGFTLFKQVAEDFLPALGSCFNNIKLRIAEIPGSSIEDNKFSLSVHYRNVETEESCERLHNVVKEEVAKYSDKLEARAGKKVHEIRPKIEWHKGEAIQFLLNNIPEVKELDNNETQLIPIILGDDITDEDGFKSMYNYDNSISIFVTGGNNRPTHAKYTLNSVDEVQQFLQRLTQL